MSRTPKLSDDTVDSIIWLRRKGQDEIKTINDEITIFENAIARLVKQKKAIRRSISFETLAASHDVKPKALNDSIQRRLYSHVP